MGVLIEHRAEENKGVLRKRRRGKILPSSKDLIWVKFGEDNAQGKIAKRHLI